MDRKYAIIGVVGQGCVCVSGGGLYAKRIFPPCVWNYLICESPRFYENIALFFVFFGADLL